jgi:alpha-glucoside transport system substrate-binding protein
MSKNKTLIVLLLLASVFLMVACGGGATDTADDDVADDSGGEMSESNCPDWSGMSAELDAACRGEYDGTVVTMSGPFTDEDEVKFNEAVAEFEDWTGIDIQYTGSKEFEATITASVEGGAAPDIADFPQPGFLLTFVERGYTVDVSTFLDQSWLEENYKQAWLDMAMMDGQMAGIWARYNGKSQVWYPKDDWDAAGYVVPETWDELLALSDQIVADGDAPWCVGIESGAATGWPATDWMEEIMLRTTSLENYDNWSFPADPANRLPFTSPEVKHAAEVLGELWFTDNYVYGGQDAITTTFFGDAPNPMFDDPPGCWLHKQGNFITSFFEGYDPNAVAGVDYDFFYLPGVDPAYGKPYLIAGDIYTMFNDRPEVRAVMDFFTRGESLKTWVAAGGALAPHNDVALDWYGDDLERSIAAAVQAADSVRFDGSDLMPGPVGTGTFWKGMTDWMSGSVDLDTALEEIDAGWPE